MNSNEIVNLYSNLSYNIPSQDLTNDEKEWLVEEVPKLNLNEKKIVYSLILYDHIRHNPASKIIYPYKCKQLGGDKLEIKLDALPNRTKRIVYKFVNCAILKENEK